MMKLSAQLFLCLAAVMLIHFSSEAQEDQTWSDSVKLLLPGTWVVEKTTMNGRVRREFTYTGNQMIFTAKEVWYVGSEKDTSRGSWEFFDDSTLLVNEEKGPSKDLFKILYLDHKKLLLERKSKGGNIFRYTMRRKEN